MTIWFTADQHFGHKNIIEYCNRPFENVNDMDESIISRWNQVVRYEDTVYCLGDFCLNGWKTVTSILGRLNGNKFFILGGHDEGWAKSSWAKNSMIILPPLVTKTFAGSTVITMCHYPLLSWERSHYGAHHLHGHTHGTIGTIGSSADKLISGIGQDAGKRMDVGVDCHNFYPVSLEEVLALLIVNS